MKGKSMSSKGKVAQAKENKARIPEFMTLKGKPEKRPKGKK